MNNVMSILKMQKTETIYLTLNIKCINLCS